MNNRDAERECKHEIPEYYEVWKIYFKFQDYGLFLKVNGSLVWTVGTNSVLLSKFLIWPRQCTGMCTAHH